MSTPATKNPSLGTPLRPRPNPHAPFSKSRRRRLLWKIPLRSPEQLFEWFRIRLPPNVFGIDESPADDYHPDLVALDGVVIRRRPLTLSDSETTRFAASSVTRFAIRFRD
jgi:hypothetical protein